jgi:anti-sigma28 factor (negative regulator of flagellin synthesis)
MVNFGTSVAGSIPPSAKQVVVETAAASSAVHAPRRQRIQRLREVIEAGQYRVSAGELADAILRAARSAN